MSSFADRFANSSYSLGEPMSVSISPATASSVADLRLSVTVRSPRTTSPLAIVCIHKAWPEVEDRQLEKRHWRAVEGWWVIMKKLCHLRKPPARANRRFALFIPRASACAGGVRAIGQHRGWSQPCPEG